MQNNSDLPQPPAEDSPQEPPKSGNGSAETDNVFAPIVPPPPDEDWRYSVLLDAPRGQVVAVFEYFNAAGYLEGVIRRLNFIDADGKPDKTFLPLRYGTVRGFTGWHTRG